MLWPAEVLRLGADRQVVFVRGLAHPILATRVRYYAEKCFAGLWDRWRDGAVVVPLMLELKPLRLEHRRMRIGGE